MNEEMEPGLSFWKMLGYQLLIPVSVAIYAAGVVLLMVVFPAVLIYLMYVQVSHGVRPKVPIDWFWKLEKYIYNGATALWAYPLYYYFKNWVNKHAYKYISFEEAKRVIESDRITEPDIFEVRKLLAKSNKIAYWLWTYGDLDTCPEWAAELSGNEYKSWKSYYYWSVIRNARFNYYYLYSSIYIDKDKTVDLIDTKTEGAISSPGINNVKPGILLREYTTIKGKKEIFFENAWDNKNFYIGYINSWSGDRSTKKRWETSYRR